MMQQKLRSIFGLSKTAPACASAEQKTFIETSDTGLFLDEMDELNLKMVPASADCKDNTLQPNSIWLLMDKARNSALLAMETDLITGLSTINKLKTEPFTGFLGVNTIRGLMPFSEGQVITTTIKNNAVSGNIIKIKSIGLHSTVSGVVPVTINGTVYNINTTALTLNANVLPTPITIPLNGQDIVISYTVSGFMVGNNKMCYGCAGVLRKLTPYFPDIEGQEGNGLVLGIEVTCIPDNVVYENYNNRLVIKKVMGYAARFKAAELLIERILNSGEINRYTMLDGVYLDRRVKHFRKEYWDRVNWLVGSEGFDLSADTCYTCKPEAGFKKRGILI